MLVIENLDGATFERAGALVAREHAAARQVRPELPAAFDSAEVCTAALPRLPEALSNLGFGRYGACGIQPAAPRRRSGAVAVHAAGSEHLDTIARLALVEIQYRSAPAMFAPPPRPAAGRPGRRAPRPARGRRRPPSRHPGRARRRPAHHRADLAGTAAVPDGQPYIAPRPPCPARGKGVGHALVDTALTWAYDHGYQWFSVDFGTANPLSRPFWLNAGFHPAGYDVRRLIDGGAGSTPNGPGSAGGH
jgi:hypothetical protein